MKRTLKYSDTPTTKLVQKNCLPTGNIGSYIVESVLTHHKELAASQSAFCFTNESKKTMKHFKTNNVPVSEPRLKTSYPANYARSFEAFQKNIKRELQKVQNKLEAYELKKRYQWL
jgi:hypothetical protein